MMIPKKLEGGPIQRMSTSELINEVIDNLEDWEEYIAVVGLPAALTKNGTPYTTYATAVRISDEITESAAKRLLSKLAHKQLAEASRAGRLIVRLFPELSTDNGDCGNRFVTVRMRYAIE